MTSPSGLLLDEPLVTAAREGRIVLFLGAGASHGAKNSRGECIPDGKALGQLIAQKFLKPEHEKLDFKTICDFASSTSSIRDVQQFIRDTLVDFSPTAAHLEIPKFVWAGIATTNYDLLIERAYEATPQKLQNLVPYTRNRSIEIGSLIESDLLYAKLHGCLTEADDTKVPLVATTEQIIRSASGRSNLFKQFLEWGQNQTLVFIGYGMEDSNLRTLIDSLVQEGDARRRHYLVRPDFDSIEADYWRERRIHPIQTDFAGFISAMERSIPSSVRPLTRIALDRRDSTISRFVSVSGVRESDRLISYIEHGFEHVSANLGEFQGDAQRFYSGFDQDWYPIEADLDVGRKTNELLIQRCILRTAVPSEPHFFLLKAHAGAGKTITLRRVAWEAAKTYEKLVFFLRPGASLDFDLIEEIVNLTNQTIFIFVDDAGDRIDSLRILLNLAARRHWPLIIIAAERVNEWNLQGQDAEALIDEEFKLPYLSESEIIDLVDLLERHDSLGELASLTPEERVDRFTEFAGRQLLVALHESTRGLPLEQILEDEYSSIQPREARLLYLDICALHRLGPPVRAGLISRVHGISFEDFANQFFEPLENVVSLSKDKKSGDYAYQARHSYIADIVFETVVKDRQSRFDLLARIIGKLNPDYSYDNDVLFHMIRAKTIAEWFPDPSLGRALYDIAEESVGRTAGLAHQRGLYEMRVSGDRGGLDRAASYFAEAAELDPTSRAFKHSLSELALKRSELARSPLEAESYRREAARVASELASSGTSSYPYHTLAKVALADLRDAQRNEEQAPSDLTTEAVSEAINRAENAIRRGLNQFPNDPFLLVEEAELGKLLRNANRALQALTKAFRQNTRSELIANRLALIHISQDNLDLALGVLQKALNSNPGSRVLHFRYVRTRMTQEPNADISDSDQILYHLRRSFSPGDNNLEAQFWYARQLCLMDRGAEAKQIFDDLARRKVPIRIRQDIQGKVLDEQGAPTRFYGVVSYASDSFGFIQQSAPNIRVFFTVDRDAGDSQIFGEQDRVSYALGFNMRGPIATNLARV